jgi:hypothetical protein
MNLDKAFFCKECGNILVGLDEAPQVCPGCGSSGESVKPVPFELFEKTNIQHFGLQTGEVEVGSASMPLGIGLEQQKLAGAGQTEIMPGLTQRSRGRVGTGDDEVLVDPMTNEVISKVVDYDENGNVKYDVFGNPLYVVNDHWFRIQAKLTWKSSSKAESEKAEAQDEEDSSSSKRRRSVRRRRR